MQHSPVASIDQKLSELFEHSVSQLSTFCAKEMRAIALPLSTLLLAYITVSHCFSSRINPWITISRRDTTPDMEDKMLKILCLHGRRQNKEILKTKLGNLTRKLKKYATLTIVDAPHVVETDAGENAEAMGGIPSGRVWYRRHDDNTLDFNMLEESLEYLAKLWNENGGYDGIIGFSMGASLAGIISHRSSESVFSGLKFVVGAGGRDVPELLEGSQICPSIQSLHFAGKTDEIVSPEDSEMLSRRYSSAVFIEHERGHMWPTQAEYMNTIVEFVEQQSVAKLAAIS